MKPNTHSGAGKHDPTGIPTGLNRKARRAVHATLHTQNNPDYPPEVIQHIAVKHLDEWTDNKLSLGRLKSLVSDAYDEVMT